MSEYYIGVDLGGTNIKIGCFDSEIKLIQKTSVPTGADMGPEVVASRIVDQTKYLVKECGISMDDVVGVGIGTPGPADYAAGIVIQSSNMKKFNNTPLRDMIEVGLIDQTWTRQFPAALGERLQQLLDDPEG